MIYRLMNEYFDYLKLNSKVSYVNVYNREEGIMEINPIIEINTPFLDVHNDIITIYIKRSENMIPNSSFLLINDDVINDEVGSSEKSKQYLQEILNGFGKFTITDNQLCIVTTLETFNENLHAIIQASIAISFAFHRRFDK